MGIFSKEIQKTELLTETLRPLVLPLQLEAYVIGLFSSLVKQLVRFVTDHFHQHEIIRRVANGLKSVVLVADDKTVWDLRDDAGGHGRYHHYRNSALQRQKPRRH